jgi:hypothetical protein
MIEVIYIVRHAVRMKLVLRPHTTLRKTVRHIPHTGQGVRSVSVATLGSSSNAYLAPSMHHRPRRRSDPRVTNLTICTMTPLNDILSNGQACGFSSAPTGQSILRQAYTPP